MTTVTSKHDQQPYRSTSPPNQLASKENDRELHCMIKHAFILFNRVHARSRLLAIYLISNLTLCDADKEKIPIISSFSSFRPSSQERPQVIR